jgi:SAM-dependent methyltransferase
MQPILLTIMNEHSFERIVPDMLDIHDAFDRGSLKLHMERYDFAIQKALHGRILDIACGTGYGSYQMLGSDKLESSSITAVDVSRDAIEYGMKRYNHSSLDFICTDVMDFSDSKFYDTIVSLETIEHLKEPVSFIQKMYLLLKKGGMLIASAPVTLSTDVNPYHLSDFTASSFRQLFDPMDFQVEAELFQIQPYSVKDLFRSGNKRLNDTRSQLPAYYLRHPRTFVRRIRSLFRDGLNNKYLTLALKKK